MFRCYTHANLVKIHLPVHEIIVETRKCHANANAHADTKGIRTQNNMSLSPSVGDVTGAKVI